MVVLGLHLPAGLGLPGRETGSVLLQLLRQALQKTLEVLANSSELPGEELIRVVLLIAAWLFLKVAGGLRLDSILLQDLLLRDLLLRGLLLRDLLQDVLLRHVLLRDFLLCAAVLDKHHHLLVVAWSRSRSRDLGILLEVAVNRDLRRDLLPLVSVLEVAVDKDLRRDRLLFDTILTVDHLLGNILHWVLWRRFVGVGCRHRRGPAAKEPQGRGRQGNKAANL
mmetsp:Transcript_108660/g.242380  ORF Transcript_108660/g.242380 Transcript_108660/m.242380 type:complete len:223 (-) Transcript_108660:4-672(-)